MKASQIKQTIRESDSSFPLILYFSEDVQKGETMLKRITTFKSERHQSKQFLFRLTNYKKIV